MRSSLHEEGIRVGDFRVITLLLVSRLVLHVNMSTPSWFSDKWEAAGRRISAYKATVSSGVGRWDFAPAEVH